MATQASPGRNFEWTLGDRLAKSRRAADLTRAQMAERLNVSDQSIRNWESDVKDPRLVHLRAWANVTGVRLAWLTDGEEPAEMPPGGGGGPRGPVGPPSPHARNPRSNLLVTSSKITKSGRNTPDGLPSRNPGKVSPLVSPHSPSHPRRPVDPAKRAA